MLTHNARRSFVIGSYHYVCEIKHVTDRTRRIKVVQSEKTELHFMIEDEDGSKSTIYASDERLTNGLEINGFLLEKKGNTVDLVLPSGEAAVHTYTVHH